VNPGLDVRRYMASDITQPGDVVRKPRTAGVVGKPGNSQWTNRSTILYPSAVDEPVNNALSVPETSESAMDEPVNNALSGEWLG
jgi:hypothetical protein